MKREFTKITVIIVVSVFISGLFVCDAFAQSPVRKLGRGLANAVTGMLELPQSIVDVSEEEGALAAVTYGVAKGIAMSFVRMTVGVYEVVTFPIPLPFDYAPIVEPEFMMDDENY
jgi:putative exosortase-associated protein (TIGR04073 family)